MGKLRRLQHSVNIAVEFRMLKSFVKSFIKIDFRMTDTLPVYHDSVYVSSEIIYASSDLFVVTLLAFYL